MEQKGVKSNYFTADIVVPNILKNRKTITPHK